MRKLTIVAGLATAAAIAAGGTAAFAAGKPPTASPSAPKAPAVSNEQAVRAALAVVPGGWVTATELEDEHGRQVWDIEVRTAKGAEREITVDAVKGSVLHDGTGHKTDDRAGREDDDKASHKTERKDGHEDGHHRHAGDDDGRDDD
ncbi:PepSY domain-containing protein [Microtetraspora sp. NBRC 16547]|uniref:PepSY domain-containing protein n=1 Tax=Microtetraspora sp. NBRC 16547 TaxID=3030993 RepID=UPI0024A53078|nr:PepSY domain-containing protein [Microtetraspora sp. NBRC 16547]GLW99237.1 hypothetical protein Misp02_33240 [Microtetraspora sp. NBRC 16547]